jgi:hypothetical protein
MENSHEFLVIQFLCFSCQGAPLNRHDDFAPVLVG